MLGACLILIPASTLLAILLTFLARALGHRLNALDGPGVQGQTKAEIRKVPNTGGIAIFWTIALPLLLGIILVNTPSLADRASTLLPAITPHLQGLRDTTYVAAWFLACLFILHLVGLIDDRKPLGPIFKLLVMLALACIVVFTTQSRLLTLLDSALPSPLGYALSVALTVLWFIVVTNAMNFMDNMDGLTAGVAAIAASCFFAGAMIHENWFVGALLALVVGASLGFLTFNFPIPRATIFMGDSGSLTLGFALAFLTVRATYLSPNLAGGWYALLMPLIVLAVPIYDFLSVVFLRLSQRRSPFVGDLQHLSHRLVDRGLSRRAAVIVIHGLTAITALGAISLGSLTPWQAAIVGAQTLLVLMIVAIYEHRTRASKP